MALICNGYRFGHMPHQIRSGMLTTIYNGMGMRDISISGRNRNITAGQGITSDRVGVPMGYLAPGSWILPQKSGNLSSHNNARGLATATATPYWTMRGASAGSSTATLTGYTVAQAAGLIEGECTVTGAVGGYAWCSGQANGSCTASLGSYATGSLSGHIYVNQSEATVTQIVNGIWDADTDEHDLSGSMGEAVKAAGTAGDPWTTELPGSYTGNQAGNIIGKKVLTTAKFLGLK